jgi:hypothetical protein
VPPRSSHSRPRPSPGPFSHILGPRCYRLQWCNDLQAHLSSIRHQHEPIPSFGERYPSPPKPVLPPAPWQWSTTNIATASLAPTSTSSSSPSIGLLFSSLRLPDPDPDTPIPGSAQSFPSASYAGHSVSSSVPASSPTSSSTHATSAGPCLHDYAIPAAPHGLGGITQLRPGLLGIPTGPGPAVITSRTKLHPSVTFAALVLLQRLKARFPTTRGSSGHCLFISAFMIASKVICDDTYSNKSWSIVAQGMYNLREINQMEREMCSYLEWELTVDNAILANFQAMVKRDFRGPGPYPTYSLHMVSKKANSMNNATTASGGATISQPTPPPSGTSTSPIPSFGQRNPSPPKPVLPPPPSSATSMSTASSNARSSSAAAIQHTQYPRHAHHHHAPPAVVVDRLDHLDRLHLVVRLRHAPRDARHALVVQLDLDLPRLLRVPAHPPGHRGQLGSDRRSRFRGTRW